MMNDLIIRLFIVKDNKIIESSFDSRLSFKDNIFFLNEMLEDISLDNLYIYDANKRIFLDMNKRLSDMGIYSFMTFYLY